MKLQTIVSIATLTLLAACVHPNCLSKMIGSQAENVNDFTADGRLASKVEEKGSYANFDWSYQIKSKPLASIHLWAVRSDSYVKTTKAYWL